MKIFKNLPENAILIDVIGFINPNKAQQYFYIGTSDLISLFGFDLFKTNYNIMSCYQIDDNQTSIKILLNNNKKIEAVTGVIKDYNRKIIKIGITKNVENRLKYYKKEIYDFRIIKGWNVNNAFMLENLLIDENYKSGFCSYGSEWFWGKNEDITKLINKIDALINNTYIKTNNGYKYYYKKE